MVEATLVPSVHVSDEWQKSARALAPYMKPCPVDMVHESETPRATATHHPVPHGRVLEAVYRSLVGSAFDVGREAHQLSHKDARYHAVLELIPRADRTSGFGGDCGDGGSRTILLGIRNSHDKSKPLGLVSGTHIRVCSNGLFNGAINISSKHTTHIESRLNRLVDSAVGSFVIAAQKQGKQIATYKQTELTDEAAALFLVKSLRSDAICGSDIKKVIKAYDSPPHPEFEERNLWSMVNAFTEVYKSMSVDTVLKRSQRLHMLADTTAGYLAV